MRYDYSDGEQSSRDSNKGKATKNKGFKKLVKILVSTIVLTTCIVVDEAVFAPQVVEAATTQVVVNTNTLNVRKGPGTNYGILGTVKKNTKLTVQTKMSNGWYKISFKGKTGYVSGSYVKEASKDTKVYTMNVPVIRQNPELPAGCEVTSLAMALRYKGVKVDKMKLAKKMPYTKTYDPNKGYVGSPYNSTGYTINPVKLQSLAKTYRARSKNLTGASIATIENEVRNGNPVLVWYTIVYVDVRNNYKYKNNKKYWWPQPLHCIVVTGVGQKNFYINDPLNGKKNYAIEKARFNKVYTAMGKRALVVR